MKPLGSTVDLFRYQFESCHAYSSLKCMFELKRLNENINMRKVYTVYANMGRFANCMYTFRRFLIYICRIVYMYFTLIQRIQSHTLVSLNALDALAYSTIL
jgi:hypothetical protein